MKRGEMTLDRLVRLLLALPVLPGGQLCVECEDHGFKEVAVICEPMGGEYLCAECAVQYARENKAGKADLELAVRIRRFFLVNPTECSACAQLAQRLCSYCAAPVCEEHKVYIPRTGCACRECAAALEEEEVARCGSGN
jgi:hypothetical protein